MFDGLADRAGAADLINRLEVVSVAAGDADAARQVDAERCAKEVVLDVVDGQGVAGEQRLDVAVSDELFEVSTAAGVDDDWASYDGDTPAT